MPYLEVQKQQTEELVQTIEMPDLMGITIEEAKKILVELGLEAKINGEGETVIEQLPKKGIQVNAGTKVTVYVR